MIAYPFGVEGRVTRVLEAGTGQRHVLLLHGAAARADRWLGTMEALAAEGYHAFAIDLPGHGFASKGEGDYSIGAFANFVSKFLEARGIAPCHVVGTSIGGHVTAVAAAINPHLFASLVLVGSTGLAPVGAERTRAMSQRIRDTSRDGISTKLSTLVADADLVTDAWREEEYRINNSPGAAEGFASLSTYFREQLDADVLTPSQLKEIVSMMPVLLIWGEEDKPVPIEVGKQVAETLPEVTLMSIPEAGHAPYLERPETFARVLLDFLESRSG